MLLSLFSNGTLPWSTSPNDVELRRRKAECDVEALATSLNCPEVGGLYEYGIVGVKLMSAWWV